MNEYDVILVGGGITNISLALSLIKSGLSVIMFEKGNDIYHRSCPKTKVGTCVNCKPSCQITTGFSGAGCFSDTKLTYSPDIGGRLIDYIGPDKFNIVQDEVDKMFTQYGASEVSFFDEEFANTLQYECSKYGMKLQKGKIRHLGTDGSYKVMCNMYQELCNAPNFTLKCNTEVHYIDMCHNFVGVKGAEYTYKYLSVAVGRYGAEWLRDICDANNVKVTSTAVDLGVRVECPRSITDFITDKLYEFKIVNYSSSDNAVRTFCINPGGYVVQENYNDTVAVNGHSNSQNESLNTNFALLVSSNFTEPFNDPIRYAKSVCELTNLLADGRVMVQRLVDLKSKKRSTKARMSRLSIEPSLKDAAPGDLRYALPANILDSIIETIDNLANVIPNINGKNTILYGPEVKFVSSCVEVTNNLGSKIYPNVYFGGDGAGITRGIIQAAMCGKIIAQNIIAQNIINCEKDYK